MNEIKDTSNEIKEVGKSSFLDIKPESDIRSSEAKSFIEDKFNNSKSDLNDKANTNELIDGNKHYYDDNEKEYRIDDNLLSNETYEINGYKYETDNLGRNISAEGKLHMKEDRDKKKIEDSMDTIGKGDQKDTDDRGHLIGDQFDGGAGLENLVPQDAKVNRETINKIETNLANEVKAGKDVYLKVEPVYDGDSYRPEGFSYTYTIDGEKTQIFILNESE